MPYSGPGDFSAWYQVFLNGQWITWTLATTTADLEEF